MLQAALSHAPALALPARSSGAGDEGDDAGAECQPADAAEHEVHPHPGVPPERPIRLRRATCDIDHYNALSQCSQWYSGIAYIAELLVEFGEEQCQAQALHGPQCHLCRLKQGYSTACARQGMACCVPTRACPHACRRAAPCITLVSLALMNSRRRTTSLRRSKLLNSCSPLPVMSGLEDCRTTARTCQDAL